MHTRQQGGSSNVGAAFETKCKIIAEHREELIKMGILDSSIQELFHLAQEAGFLEPVKKMLLLYLSKS